MTETMVVSFHIDGGIITSVREYRAGEELWTRLTDPRDIEDAVARVANAPVGGKNEAS